MTNIPREDGLSIMSSLLQGHFEDDKRQFAKNDNLLDDIIRKLDKREQIAIEHAHHFSSMGKELAVMNSFLAEMKPMLEEYQDNQAAMRALSKYSSPVIAFLKGAGIAIAGFAAIWGAFRAAAIYLIK